jgi:hypothetical protein
MTLQEQFENESGWAIDFIIDDIVEDFVMAYEYYEKYSEWLENKINRGKIK